MIRVVTMVITVSDPSWRFRAIAIWFPTLPTGLIRPEFSFSMARRRAS
jgi:hypothetical protein